MNKPLSTLVIAEAGVNHNGNIDMALKLVDAAIHAGADIVKFQTFDASSVATENINLAEYQTRGAQNKNQLDMLKGFQLSHDEHLVISQYCRNRNIEFLSTAFDISSIEQLILLNMKRMKIPSGEITNIPYLRRIGKLKVPIILSSGMCRLREIEDAISILEQSGVQRNLISVLHCTSEYPAPMSEVNLLAMKNISKAFNVDVGYSDHTIGIAIATAAVAMGAHIIEKHLTLDKRLPGPDHQASLEPTEFKEMVKAIRCVELAIGDGVKRITASESKNIELVRKRIVASRPIQKGELLTEYNITTKRACKGAWAIEWDDWIGQRASKGFATDEAII